MLKGFRDFILRGNVVDLAVAVVIGAAFTAIVTAMVKDFITPLIGALVHVPDLSAHKIVFRGQSFLYGDFINAAINFLIVAAVVYFFVVLPLNTLMKRFHKDAPAAAPTTRSCPECLSDIPLGARRCSHCGQPVPAAA